MLTITDDETHNCFILEPSGTLTKRDLDALTQRFNDRVNATDRIPNLVVHTPSFPSWASFAALLRHLRFIRDHHRLIGKVALVSDARVLDLAPRVARHFVAADIRHFPADGLDEALDWVAAEGEPRSEVKVMEGLPDDVLGISVGGVITGRDYAEIIVPQLEDKLARHQRIKLIYRIGQEFTTFTAGAVWSDARVGVMHLSRFAKVAVVSDIDWIRHATRAFAPLIPGEVHVFPENALDEARAWIAAPADREEADA
jgi:hypothetical protein